MSGTTSKAPAASAGRNQSFRSQVWRRFKKHRSGMGGLVMVVFLMFVALLAPLIANDRPIAAKYKDNWHFPAFTTYVDVWVPWQGLRFSMKSFEVAGTFPMSDYYAVLEGQTWKEVELDAAIWPIVKYHPNQFAPDEIKLKPGEADGHSLGTDDLGRDVLWCCLASPKW